MYTSKVTFSTDQTQGFVPIELELDKRTRRRNRGEGEFELG